MNKVFDWDEYASLSAAAVSEGVVLLKNDNKALPIKKGERVSVFGRIQLDYYSSGTGSGGMVNTPYTISIVDGLRNSQVAEVNEELFEIYKNWEISNPFEEGVGWANEPFSQKEMPLTEEIVAKAKAASDMAIVIIGRSAGEDKDAVNEKGSYMLTDEEERMLYLVCSSFERTAVLLNVGAIMDMKWVLKYNPQAVMYVWQGGACGGRGIADVLCGISPSGRLVDTIAFNIEDYPAQLNFGDNEENYYAEDIYVGYRYFETVAKEAAMYPFGYGMGYTTFETDILKFEADEEWIRIFVFVTNTGSYPSKEVVQVYYDPAHGSIGNPVRNLVRFAKTHVLEPGQSERLAITFPVAAMASYDDTGLSGYMSCYVLESGRYDVYVGKNVRDALFAGSVELADLRIVNKLEEALAPVKPFSKMTYDGRVMTYEPVLMRQTNMERRIRSRRPEDREYTGDKGYKLSDVLHQRVSMEDFLSQLTDDDLIHISRMEGMCSPKVSGGTAGAFGGVTDRLLSFGIPIACCTDGPAGIRRDDGTMAMSLPSGTLLACTFNTELVEQLYEYEGLEMRLNKIDTLLGPGMNIHRHPLNGRNFEYFSEDPYLTGAMAVAELNGMHKAGVTGTLKHFAANNQEYARHDADSIVSERALREIYLKGYEMAVINAGAYSIMTSYGSINGAWTAGNYDLLTTILRNEWGYKGIVMTDWWAKANDELYDKEKFTATGNEIEITLDKAGLKRAIVEEAECNGAIIRNFKSDAYVANAAPLIRAQNDLYSVASNVEENTNNDNKREWLDAGLITRGELLRCAENICNFLMRSPCMETVGEGDGLVIEEINRPERVTGTICDMGTVDIKENTECSLPIDGISTLSGTSVMYRLVFEKKGLYKLALKMKSQVGGVAQMNGSIYVNKTPFAAFSLNGQDTDYVTKLLNLPIIVSVDNYVDIYFSQSGIEIGEIKVIPPTEGEVEIDCPIV